MSKVRRCATFTRGPYRFVRWGLAGALLAARTARRRVRSGGSLALDPVASAAGRTLDKGTGRFDLQMTFTLPLLGRATVSGEGSFDNAKQAMDVTMNVKGVGTGMPGSVELRLLYPALYLRADGLLPMGGQLPNGKSWVKIDAERALKNLGVDFGQLGVGQSPTGVLAWLRGSTSTKKVGTETIDGVPTTHYRGTSRRSGRARPDDGEGAKGPAAAPRWREGSGRRRDLGEVRRLGRRRRARAAADAGSSAASGT